MSKTGTYRWDAKLQQMVKVSERIPNTQVFDCFVPDGGYYSMNLSSRPGPVFVRSRKHKRELMAKRGVVEANDGLNRREL
jgi:hypothetical protein